MLILDVHSYFIFHLISPVSPLTTLLALIFFMEFQLTPPSLYIASESLGCIEQNTKKKFKGTVKNEEKKTTHIHTQRIHIV